MSQLEVLMQELYNPFVSLFSLNTMKHTLDNIITVTHYYLHKKFEYAIGEQL